MMNFPKSIAKKPLIRGLISGAALGLCTYIVSLVVGVSFNYSLTMGNIIFDMSWQIIEQTFGGISVAFVYIWIYDGNPVEVIGRKIMGD